MHGRDLLAHIAWNRHLRDLEFTARRRITVADQAAADLVLMCMGARPRWRVRNLIRCLGEGLGAVRGLPLRREMARRAHAVASVRAGRRGAAVVLASAMGWVVEASVLTAMRGADGSGWPDFAMQYLELVAGGRASETEVFVGLGIRRLERVAARELLRLSGPGVPWRLSALCAAAAESGGVRAPGTVREEAGPFLAAAGSVWPAVATKDRLLWLAAAIAFFWLEVSRSEVSNVELTARDV